MLFVCFTALRPSRLLSRTCSLTFKAAYLPTCLFSLPKSQTKSQNRYLPTHDCRLTCAPAFAPFAHHALAVKSVGQRGGAEEAAGASGRGGACTNGRAREAGAGAVCSCHRASQLQDCLPVHSRSVLHKDVHLLLSQDHLETKGSQTPCIADHIMLEL